MKGNVLKASIKIFLNDKKNMTGTTWQMEIYLFSRLDYIRLFYYGFKFIKGFSFRGKIPVIPILGRNVLHPVSGEENGLENSTT